MRRRIPCLLVLPLLAGCSSSPGDPDASPPMDARAVPDVRRDHGPFPDFFIPPDLNLMDAWSLEALPDAPAPDAPPPDLSRGDTLRPDRGPCSPAAVLGGYDDATHPMGNAVALGAGGATAFVAGTALLALDVSAPAAPRLLAKYPLPVPAQGIAVAGTTAYVADSAGGLYVFDVSAPAAPVLLGQASLPPVSGQTVAAVDVAASGTTAYVAGVAEVVAFDVSTPSAPTVTAKAAASRAYGIGLAGAGPVLAAEYGAGLYTFAAGTLMPLGGPAGPPGAEGVVGAGSHAFVADQSGGLAVVDVSSPAAPLQLGELTLPAGPITVRLAGTRAYVASGANGLAVVDVSSPTAPSFIDRIPLGGQAIGLALDGAGHAFVADAQPALVSVALGCDGP